MRVLLVTSIEELGFDHETHLLRDALTRRGVVSEIVPWGPGTDWAAADLVVVRTTWDYTPRREEFLAWAESVPVPLANPARVLRWNTHKRYLVELDAAGVPVVPTLLLEAGSPVPDAAWLGGVGEELVVKPAVSVGAIGAMRARRRRPASGRPPRRAAAEPGRAGAALRRLGRRARRDLAAVRRRRAEPCRPQGAGGGGLPRPRGVRRPELAPRAERSGARRGPLRAGRRVPARCLYARVDLVSGPAVRW